jgi:hypothetical protein
MRQNKMTRDESGQNRMPKNNQYSFLVIVHKEDSFTDQLPTSDASSEEFLLSWHQNFPQSTI